MTRKLIPVCLLLLISLIAKSQQVSPPATVHFPAPVMLPGGDSVLSRVEVEAAFIGGPDAWRAYLIKNLDVSVPVKKGAPAGIYHTIVRFMVSKNGTVSGVKTETNQGYGMEKEAVRTIKSGPKWQPATQDGKAVNAYRWQPVSFRVDGK